MLKFLIGLCMLGIIWSAVAQARKIFKRDKVIEDKREELSDLTLQHRVLNVEEDIVESEIGLQDRKHVLNEKRGELDKNATQPKT